MYAWIWRSIPGPLLMRLLVALLLLAGIVLLLFSVVFPWAEDALPFLEVTVEEDGGR